MSGSAPKERKKRVETSAAFVKASEKLLGPPVFFESTKAYSGSISPYSEEEVASWAESGVIPPEKAAVIYSPGTIADLAPRAGSISVLLAEKPELESEFSGIYDVNKEEIEQEDLYTRVSEYQEALIRLASASKLIQVTFSEISENGQSWIEVAKTNLKWARKEVTMSIAKVYQAFGKLYDKVTETIDRILSTLSGWSSQLKNELVEKIRTLSQHFIGLLNNLISALFGWLSKLREIAQEKGFRLSKVLVTIDPITLNTISVFGFPILIPEVKLPKIEMEFM